MRISIKENVKLQVAEQQKNYVDTEITAIWKEIKKAAVAGKPDFWWRLDPNDGNCEEVIRYFEDVEGILFECPTGPDDEDFTDWLVNIKTMYE